MVSSPRWIFVPHLQRNLAYQTKEIPYQKFVSTQRKYFLYLTQNKYNFVLMQKNSFAPGFLFKEKFLILPEKNNFLHSKKKFLIFFEKKAYARLKKSNFPKRK